ncbi:MAG: GH92 family glycosyl hydrolase [Bacteroidota bacterium]
MKFNIIISLIVLANSVVAQPGPASLVNPFVGTGGHGHTYPGATVPFGMVQLSPDTRIDASWDACGGYHYDDSLIYGFSHTHLSGTGVNDYGDILLFPLSSEFDPAKKISSRFLHSQEKASVGYYSVYLQDPKVDVELTVTERTGFHSYSFRNAADSAGIFIDLRHRDKVIDAQLYQIDETHLAGFRRSSAWANDQLIYFYMEFSEAITPELIKFDSMATAIDDKKLSAYSGNVYGSFRFRLNQDKNLLVKVALSSVSVDGARKNMKAENRGWDFSLVKQAAVSLWNKELGKIEVISEDTEKMKVFYTALYHCMVVPNIFNDVDGRYRGRDGKIHKTATNYYTVFSLWDTFRAWHPLMTIIDQKRSLDFIRGFLAQYEQAGMLPVWELASNETECMIGYHSVSVIADAYAKGIKEFDTEYALSAMVKSATTKSRFGLDAYMDHGYLDVLDESESVSKTLEYAYDDHCIALFAKSINNEEKYAIFEKRSNNWKNLFDNETGFIRPRRNGRFLTPFDPKEVNNHFTEANAWQYTFFVPQDIAGLIRKVGGQEKFKAKLNQLFSESTQTSGRQQADITGLVGQYAHGNEPSHHMAYLYNFTNEKWKTQYMVNKLRNEMYSNTPGGLIGNEDCGQMSAWLVMSALGIYQICPGDPVYELTSPMFREVILHLENGNNVRILSERFGEGNPFLADVLLNDRSIDRLGHSDLMSGGEIKFMMSNSRDGWSSKAQVVQESKPNYISVPTINYSSDNFKDSVVVTLTADSATTIWYSIKENGKESALQKYERPLLITNSCFVKAKAVDSSNHSGNFVGAALHKHLHPDWKIAIKSEYNKQYTAGGDDGIIDGLYGDEEWRKGGWQGYQGQDFEAVIDMGEEKNISELTAGFLQDTRSWILMPLSISYEISTDNISFKKVGEAINDVRDTVLTNTVKRFVTNFPSEKARYIKVIAKNYGELPLWHQGAGGMAFIFVDEIEVK